MTYFRNGDPAKAEARRAELLAFNFQDHRLDFSHDGLERMRERMERETHQAEADLNFTRRMVAAHDRLRSDDDFAKRWFAQASLHVGQVSDIEERSYAAQGHRLAVGPVEPSLGGRQFLLHTASGMGARTGIIAERPGFAVILTTLAHDDGLALVTCLSSGSSGMRPLFSLKSLYLATDGGEAYDRDLLMFADHGRSA